nr:PREDICTED: urocortin-3-like [Lepisosteus oculatus]XP_015203613.1 PREDICTED: urocortin-3-like [Lepisosteus oculatus]
MVTPSARGAVLLLLLMLWGALGQAMKLREQPLPAARRQAYEVGDLLAISVLDRGRALSSLLDAVPVPVSARVSPRKRTQHRASVAAPKRNPQGTWFSLSLDVPTSILSILIDLAKAKELRAKAAANAELMARIGRRK